MFDKAVILGEKSADIVEFPVTKYTCTNCGSVFCTKNDRKEETCVICGSSSLTSESYNESRSLLYIPFTKTEQDVQKDYKKKVSNLLVPFFLKRKKNYEHIQKVFLPAFLVNINQKGNITFYAGDKEKSADKKSSVIKKYEVYYKVYIDYRNVFLNILTKINEKVFINIFHYDASEASELTLAKMKDSKYVLGDLTAVEMGKRESERISKYTLMKVRADINHHLKKLKEDKSNIEFYEAKEVLLPVYILNINRRKKHYQYLMNGQTGQSYIHLPVGIFQTLLWIILFGGSVFFLTYLLIYYL